MTAIDHHVRRPQDWPVYWFAKLEKAVEEGDHEAAADAQRNLRRLGVHVRYGRTTPGIDRPTPTAEGGNSAA